jgi:hypothetical protein
LDCIQALWNFLQRKKSLEPAPHQVQPLSQAIIHESPCPNVPFVEQLPNVPFVGATTPVQAIGSHVTD